MTYAESYREVSYMDFADINRMLDEVAEDRTVPRNIRTQIAEAKKLLNNNKDDINVRINSAISILDEVSNDPNIPIYTRTQIWNVVSLLETMHGKNK